MRMLVLGAGLQGSACAYDMLETSDAQVTLADYRIGRLPPFLAPHAGGRLSHVRLDVRDEAATRAILAQHDAAVSALPYYYNLDAARLAVEAGTHFADLGGNTEIVREQERLDGQARERGVTVVPDCGLAPGMVNVLAADGIAKLDDVDSVRLYVGGLPQHPEPPLNYQVVYSLEGALDYYTTRSWVIRDGRPAEVDALTEVEEIDFRSGVGPLEAFHTAGGLSTMPWVFQGRVRSMEYKTLRYPGHAALMRAIRDLGLLGTTPVDVKDVSVRPRDVFIAVVEPALRKPDGSDMVALRVDVSGRRGDRPARIVYRLLDYRDEERGISAMMRTTGFSLSITGQLQAEGVIGPPGVRPAYLATPPDRYIDALRRRGIAIEVRET